MPILVANPKKLRSDTLMFLRRLLIGLFLCLGGLFDQHLSATTISDFSPIILSDSTLFQKIPDEQIGYILDEENQLTIDDLELQNFQALEHRPFLEIVQKGFNYWAVFTLVNPSKYERTWWLDLPGNYVRVWAERADGKMERAVTGNLLSQKDKAISGLFRNFNYTPVHMKAGEQVVVKLNLRTSSFFPVYKATINIGQPIYFKNFQHERLSKVTLSDGIYFSLMLVFSLYCLVYFFFTKRIFAFWVACYALCLIGYFFQYNSTWYRIGLSPIYAQQFCMVLVNLSLLFDFLFIRKYVRLREIAPYWDKICLWIIYFLLGFTISHAFFYWFSQNYLLTLLSVSVVHFLLNLPMFVIGFKLLKEPQRHIKVFAIGLLLLQVLLCYNHTQIGQLDKPFLKIGVSIHILTVLISLSLRAARSEKEKIKAEAERLLGNIKLAELQKLDNLKSNFFANVSHELRTPLTLILGPIQTVLKNENLGNRDYTLLRRAQQSGKDLLKLVGAILDLSKLESTKIELVEQPVSFFNLIRRVTANFESHAHQKELQFTLTYQAERNLVVSLDTEKVVIILNNLLSNALKFTPQKGSVSVKVIDEGNRLIIFVSDTGSGVHPDDLPYIFNRFYQSNQPNAESSGGTGIGLALSKEYAILMGGDIVVDSQLGEGTTFKFTLPRKEVFGSTVEIEPAANFINPKPLAKTNAENVVQAPLARTVQPSLLVVEDNSSLRAYLTTILSPYYQIIEAENGVVALDFLSNEKTTNQQISVTPNLIISDIMMPEMDGYQLLETVKNDSAFKQIPFIMLTAKAGLDSKLKALRIGVDDYLLKPFEEEELLARIENLLANSEERANIAQALSEELVETPSISKESALWLEQLYDLINTQIDQPSFSIPEMARLLNMSERSLQRQLKSLTGLSPKQYLQEIRLTKARQYLEEKTYDTVAKVAYAVGFADAKNFSRRYKQRFGKLPSSY